MLMRRDKYRSEFPRDQCFSSSRGISYVRGGGLQLPMMVDLPVAVIFLAKNSSRVKRRDDLVPKQATC
jgi:hypothetical protein